MDTADCVLHLYLQILYFTLVYTGVTLVQAHLYLCVVFENGALKINTCACVVLVLCGTKFDSGHHHEDSLDGSRTCCLVFNGLEAVWHSIFTDGVKL